jgi:hypothetical protein
MRYLLRLILIITSAVCVLFPVARLLGAQRTEGQIVYHDYFWKSLLESKEVC